MPIDFRGPIIKPLVDVVNPTHRLQHIIEHLENLRGEENEQAFTEAAVDAVDELKSWLATWQPFLQAVAVERAYIAELYVRNGGIVKSVSDNWDTASRKEKALAGTD